MCIESETKTKGDIYINIKDEGGKEWTYHGCVLVFSIKSPSNRKRIPPYIKWSTTNAIFKPKADLLAENQTKYQTQNPFKEKKRKKKRER